MNKAIIEGLEIDDFVKMKLDNFNYLDKNMANLFESMFSCKDRIMYEKSVGYRIVKTTYGESYEHILKKTGSMMKALSFADKGSIVGLAMNNSLEFIETLWTILRCGYRVLLVNIRLDDDTLSGVFKDNKIAAVVSDGKKYDIPTVMVSDIKEEEITEVRPEDFGQELFVMSSGTSSKVKICAYGTEELWNQVNTSVYVINHCPPLKQFYHNNLKHLLFLPLYHIFGFIGVYVWFCFFSCTLVELGDLSSQTILNTIKRHEITHIFSVPLFWETVYKQAIKGIKDRGDKTYNKFLKALSISNKLGNFPILGKTFRKIAFKEVRENLFGESISVLITGGSEINPEVFKFFNGIGYRFVNGFGMSEICISSFEMSNSFKLINSGSVGKPFDNVKYTIDENGCLLVESASMSRYVLEGGVKKALPVPFNTRDLAKEEKGHYYILGRHDDLVVANSGENLNPGLIEPKFNIKGINGACLIGADKEGSRISVLLLSVNKYITGERLDEIKSQVDIIIKDNKLESLINKIEYVSDDFLEANQFKFNRSKLSKKYAQGGFHNVYSNLYKEEDYKTPMMHTIREIFATVLSKDVESVSFESNFFLDEGGSSFEYYALLAAMTQEFEVNFPEDASKELTSVVDFEKYIKDKINAAD